MRTVLSSGDAEATPSVGLGTCMLGSLREALLSNTEIVLEGQQAYIAATTPPTFPRTDPQVFRNLMENIADKEFQALKDSPLVAPHINMLFGAFAAEAAALTTVDGDKLFTLQENAADSLYPLFYSNDHLEVVRYAKMLLLPKGVSDQDESVKASIKTIRDAIVVAKGWSAQDLTHEERCCSTASGIPRDREFLETLTKLETLQPDRPFRPVSLS